MEIVLYFSILKTCTNMKPFNLEAALRGEPVITRDGQVVKIAGVNDDAKYKCFVVAGWLENDLNGWHKDGVSGGESTDDLFMAPTKRKEWVVRAEESIGTVFYGPFIYPNQADKMQKNIKSEGMHATIHEITIHE